MDKNNEFGLSPEIAKLSDKLTKDPSSKLFVPLAEEYRKIGMLDEAIQVLADGLKANPNYMTARVSLGKMLLEKGNISESREEFEQVVQAIPDNLFSHKKLAEIYQSEGNAENLLKEYKIILSLSPKDEEVKNALDELEGRSALSSAEPVEEISEPYMPDIRSAPAPVEESVFISAEEETAPVYTAPPEEIPEIPAKEEVSESKEDLVYELTEELINPEELGVEILPKMTPVDEGPRTKEMDNFTASVKESPPEELATETMAEIYIKQGLLEKADAVYQQILNSEPKNMIIRQKKDELLSLMNIIKQKGSGNTIRTGKLESWLKNIKERRR
ncbi:MAG: tetratricopeptide repeat protein [Nitrospirota bacterium]